MKLSNKLREKISSEAMSAFMAALKKDHLGHKDQWWNNAPDTWSKEETEHFDLLSELMDDIVRRVIKTIDSSGAKQKVKVN